MDKSNNLCGIIASFFMKVEKTGKKGENIQKEEGVKKGKNKKEAQDSWTLST